jgi:hypothetical protein
VMSWTVAGTVERSKKITIANSVRPQRVSGDGAEPAVGAAAVTLSYLVDLLRLTRVTPSTPRRRDSSLATWV